MYALSVSAEGDCYLCLPPDPGTEAAALSAGESALPGTAPAEALHTFTLDSGASRCFFCKSTTLTPLPAPVPVRLANPSGGPVLARSSTVLPCPAVPSGSRVSICTCTRTGRHLASFTRRPGTSLYTLTTKPPQVVASPPPLPPSPAPPCLPWVEGRQRAAPHSSFPPMTDSMQSLHMGVWGPACVNGQGRERCFLVVVDNYTRYTTVFPLRSKGEIPDVLIPWIRAVRLQLRERFRDDLPVLRLHSDRGVMEVARTSMIHVAAPHFLWPFAARYPAHQLNPWLCVSFPETSSTLCWTGKVGDASVFRVRGSRTFVRNTSADKLSARAIPCDVTFDESVLFYRLFPYRSVPLPPPPPLFLAPEPLPGTVPDEVAVDSGAARGAASGDAASRGATSGGGASGGAEPASAEPGGAEPGGAEPGGTEPEGAEPGGVDSEGAKSGGVEPRGIASAGGPAGASPRLSPRREPLSPQQLREWFAQLTRHRSGAAGAGGSPAGGTGAGGVGATSPGAARTRGSGAAGAGGVGDSGAGDPGSGGTCAGGARAGGAGVGDPGVGGTGAGGAGAGGTGAGGAGASSPRGAGVTAGSRGTRGAGAAGPRGARTRGTGAAGAGGVGGTGAGDPRAGGARAGGSGAGDTGAGGTGAKGAGAGGPGPGGAGAGGIGAGGTMQRRPFFFSATAVPDSPMPAPSPYTEQTDSFIECRELESLPALPSTTTSALFVEHVDFSATCRLDYATSLVAESESDCPLSVKGECALCTNVLEDRQEDFECLAAAVPHLVAMLLAPEGAPEAPDILTLRSYAQAITGPYSSQWQAAMDAEMGVEFFQTFSLTPKTTTLRVLLHVATQRDYELHSLDFSKAFLQGSLHKEIWLRCPPGFTRSFPAGTQWSLRRPVYRLHQAPREWHDTLRTTIAALGFAPSTADPSLFLRTDTSLPPFYVLVYVDNLVFATAGPEALALVKAELQMRHTCTNLGELRSYFGLQIIRDSARRTITLTQSHMVHQVLQRFGFRYSSPQSTPLPTGHSLSAPPSVESVEPSGPYPELVGCLMVLRYLCNTSSMGLVLGGRGPVVLTGHTDASWVDDLATQRSSQGYTFSLGSDSVSWRSTRSSSVLSSSCEAEIYVGAMAAQELRWLTHLLTDLGERPRSSPILYIDNKAMIALCREHRLEHRTKHIALRYFLARELQQRGQLRFAYVATRANTADIFTKALQTGDHQRFCTVLGLVTTLPHLLTA
ncbi:unnamed protein product [Closterium sp. NIES-54]